MKKDEDILISRRAPTAAQVDELRAERAEAGALATVIDLGRGVITTGPWVMPFKRIAFPVRTLRRRVGAAIQRANTGSAHMVLDPKHYEGRDRYLAEQLEAISVQGSATLAEVAGRDLTAPATPEDGNKAQIAEAEAAWREYCNDAASTLAMFGATELVL